MAPRHLLFGRDNTPGIVSISADRSGHAMVWRREGETVHREELRFLNWFLVRDPRLLAELPATSLSPNDLVGGLPELPNGLGLMALSGSHPFRYLVLTDRLSELESTLLGLHNKRTGDQARGLSALRDDVYWVSPVHQYLILSGRTYFKGMAYSELRRLQFDLETTGLNETRDRIFMINVSDSTGFRVCLDTGDMSERELLEAFVALVRERDPDVLENHNLFGFDIPFLIYRAAALGVNLALGRDGGTFQRKPDVYRFGERSQAFVRYSLVGREIVDTMHAVKRYSASARDLRYHGLKEVARYFGVAPRGREYVAGAEIWNTFQVDPERVRRYGGDDVIEVDELSKVLLAPAFVLASMVPKPYQQVVTTGVGQELAEPLLVRAYLAAGHSLPAGQPGGGVSTSARPEVFTTGLVPRVVRVDVSSLSPSLLLRHKLAPRADELGVYLQMLDEATRLRMHHAAEAGWQADGTRQRGHHEARQSAFRQLVTSLAASLGAPSALFGDREAAEAAGQLGREVLGQFVARLEQAGAIPIQAGGDSVFLGLPVDWSEADEARRIAEAADGLAPGTLLEIAGRYRAMYSYGEKDYALRDYEGTVRIVGSAFRSIRYERYTERFLTEAIERLLAREPAALRALYRDFAARLRERQVSVDELCVSTSLSKTPEQYRRAERREEPYELLLAAGHHEWRPGERVRSYHALGERKRLAEEYADDYDVEYYVAKLRRVGLQRLAKALPEGELQSLLAEEPAPARPEAGEVQLVMFHERDGVMP